MVSLIVFPLLFVAVQAADTIRVTLPLATETTGVWHISKASADVPRNAVSPTLISAPQRAHRKDTPAVGLFSVSFQITEKGIPVNIQVEKSSNKELDDEVIAMIREWRFAAALRGDVPVASQAYIDLSLGDPLHRENGRGSRKKQ
jgi:TonB family protein